MRYHLIPVRLAAIQSLTHTLAEAAGKQALSPTAGGMQNGPPLRKGSLVISMAITNASALGCGNSTSGNLSHSRTCHVQNDTCTRLHTAAWFLTIN